MLDNINIVNHFDKSISNYPSEYDYLNPNYFHDDDSILALDFAHESVSGQNRDKKVSNILAPKIL